MSSNQEIPTTFSGKNHFFISVFLLQIPAKIFEQKLLEGKNSGSTKKNLGKVFVQF